MPSGRLRRLFELLRRSLAGLLLAMVVVLLAIDPLWEYADHLDDLRHLGPHGILVVFLVLAWGCVTLFRTFRWLEPGQLRALDSTLPQPARRRWRSHSTDLLTLLWVDAVPLPIRI